jgi:flagellar hook protein FlgE
MNANGVISYSRNGQFNIDKNGFIVNTSGDRLTGYAADAQGTILTSSPTDISVDTADLAPRVTTEASLGVNLDSRKTPPLQPFVPATNGPPSSVTEATSMSVYDTLGNPHILTLSFIKLPPNQADGADYTVFASLDGDPAISPGAPNVLPATGTRLVFDTSGILTTTMPLQPSFPIATGANPTLTFDLDLTGSTQFGSGFGVNKLVQDGYASGRLSGLNISADGVVQGRYSNGQSRNLGQVVLANFANPNGLQSIGNNQWAESAESGQPLIGAPGTGSLGGLQSAAVEDSNVDLTGELVSMITQQRAYQANAQSIKTQDQILQTLVNLR